MYFDYSSTTPIHDDVLQSYTKILSEYYGNADSLHEQGNATRKLMDKSRAQIAQFLFVDKDELLFTSCASESNNYAIKGYALRNHKRGKHLITSCVEHSSVLHACEQLQEMFDFEVTYLPVNKNGCVDPLELKRAMRKDTILVSLMYVNNESGAINPIEELAGIVHEQTRCVFHVDCVQALGKIDVSLASVDMATFSAHKIYGLKGSGLLYKKKNIALLPLLSGGQQEYGLRGGTSNAPSNIVFAKTLRLALENQKKKFSYVKELQHMLKEALRTMEDVTINSPDDAIPHIVNVSFLKIGSEIMLNALDERGICVSAQSTCSSKSKAHSYVLAAMGLGEQVANHAIRISLSHLTTKEEVHTLIQALKEINHDFRTK